MRDNCDIVDRNNLHDDGHCNNVDADDTNCDIDVDSYRDHSHDNHIEYHNYNHQYNDNYNGINDDPDRNIYYDARYLYHSYGGAAQHWYSCN